MSSEVGGPGGYGRLVHPQKGTTPRDTVTLRGPRSVSVSPTALCGPGLRDGGRSHLLPRELLSTARKAGLCPEEGRGPTGGTEAPPSSPVTRGRPCPRVTRTGLFPRESLRSSGGRAWDGDVGREGAWGQLGPCAINRLLGADPKQRALG